MICLKLLLSICLWFSFTIFFFFSSWDIVLLLLLIPLIVTPTKPCLQKLPTNITSLSSKKKSQSYFSLQNQMMISVEFSWNRVAWIHCINRCPHLWSIRLYRLAPLPCRQWWIWFISMVASSAHSHSTGWQWQTGAGSPHICLAKTAGGVRMGWL